MNATFQKNNLRRKTYWVAAAILFAVGCGKGVDNRAGVGGEVKLDGKPIPEGTIAFVPCDGTKGPTAGGRIADGRYQVTPAKGPAIGTNRVEIRAFSTAGLSAKAMAKADESGEDYGEMVAPRFNSASSLKVEIKAGGNTANFEVSSK